MGRFVRVWSKDGDGPSTRAFYVGSDDQDSSIVAVSKLHPQFRGCLIDADETLSSTTMAFLDMKEDEVRDRVAG